MSIASSSFRVHQQSNHSRPLQHQLRAITKGASRSASAPVHPDPQARSAARIARWSGFDSHSCSAQPANCRSARGLLGASVVYPADGIDGSSANVGVEGIDTEAFGGGFVADDSEGADGELRGVAASAVAGRGVFVPGCRALVREGGACDLGSRRRAVLGRLSGRSPGLLRPSGSGCQRVRFGRGLRL